MDVHTLEQLLRARFTGFLADHAPPLETHPEQLARPAPHPSTWPGLAERGALGVLAPRDVGGLGLGQTGAVIVAELMGTAAFPAGHYLDSLLGLDVLHRCHAPAGTLADVVSGRQVLAVAYRAGNAPDALDDLPAWSAVGAHPGHHLISTRRWGVTAADEATTLLLLGTGSPGAVLVPTADVSVLLEERSTLGHRRVFDVDVDRARVRRSDAFPLSPRSWAAALGCARLRQAAYLTGLAAGALDQATTYARGRRQFGHSLTSFQSIAFRLAALSCRVHAARLLVRDVARRVDAAPGGEPAGAAAQALALAVEVARATAAYAVHVHGASGTTLRAPVQRYFREIGADSVWLGTPPDLRRTTVATLTH
jgi:alkylation response protein AidB-like acyl-CoA dehydrogenase